MIVVPLVFASLFVGTAGMNNLKRLGKIGVRTLSFYLLSTALAISIGLLIVNWFIIQAVILNRRSRRNCVRILNRMPVRK